MSTHRNRIIATTIAVTVALAGTGLAARLSDRTVTGTPDSALVAGPGSTDFAGTHGTAPAPPTLIDGSTTAVDGATPTDTRLGDTRSPAHAGAPLVEVVPGAGGRPLAETGGILGELDDDGPVPAGLGLTAPPKAKPATNGLAGPGSLAVAPSCSHQCITSGVAYPRGFGVELVVETEVPAKLFLTAVADANGDGDFEESHADFSSAGITSHSWALDHLLPGVTYHAMVAATDDDGHTAYAWGEFTTLSTRKAVVEIGDTTVYGGPSNVVATSMMLGLGGPLANVTPGEQGILLYQDLPRLVDLDYWVTRQWDAKLCEAWTVKPTTSPQGDDSASCLAWNSASAENVDLDVVPAGKTRWTEASVQLPLQTPTGEGGSLPPGYGDPRYFSFTTTVTLHVIYS